MTTGETGAIRLNGPCVTTCWFHPPKQKGIHSKVNLLFLIPRLLLDWRELQWVLTAGLSAEPRSDDDHTLSGGATEPVLAEGWVCSRTVHLSWTPIRVTYGACGRVVSGLHSINIHALAKKINLCLYSAAVPSHVCQDLFVLTTRATCAKFKWCGRTTPTQHKEAYIFSLMHLN